MASIDSKYYYPASNFNKYFNNKNFVNVLLTSIKKNMKRDLTRNESSYIIEHLQNTNPTLFKNPPEVIFKALVTDIVEKFNTQPCAPDKYDIHETLKAQIGLPSDDNITGGGSSSNTFSNSNSDKLTSQINQAFANTVSVNNILGTTNLNDLRSLFSTDSKSAKTASIIMDTRYRGLDTDGTRVLKWVFQGTTSVAQGTTNSSFDIQNITAMRVKEIRMPYTKSADNQYRRISMYISNFTSQAVIAQENVYYHFMFHPENDGRWINLRLNRDIDGYFKFKSPISSINNLDVSFGSPLESIIFDPDRMNMSITNYGTTITLTGTSPHNLETGDLVYIKNFTTLNPAYDINITSVVNDQNGIRVIYVDDYNIALGVDTTPIKFVGAGTIATTDASAVIVGSGTSFRNNFNIGDGIVIAGIIYIVTAVTSDTSLTLSRNYVGTSTGLTYSKNNTVLETISVYFGAKRMFIEMEFEYY
jgi:hypothetical protein